MRCLLKLNNEKSTAHTASRMTILVVYGWEGQLFQQNRCKYFKPNFARAPCGHHHGGQFAR
jgi:hypothetical protein